MPLTARENDVLPGSRESTQPSSSPTGSAREESSTRQQAVALEVGVTVKSAPAGAAGEKDEPLSVSTKTVLVFGQGAVIRLNRNVVPGQLLFLTNEKTKKEVVCEVVKSKMDGGVSGYVEVKFTHAMPGFWGMRFAGDQAAIESPKPVPIVEAAPTASAAGFGAAPDTVADFKTELKTDDHSNSRVELVASATDPAAEGLKIENSRLQEQLSSLLFAESASAERSSSLPQSAPQEKEFAGAAARLLEMGNAEKAIKDLPVKKVATLSAPPIVSPTSTATLKVEEVKVPAWLEPLTHNSGGKLIPAKPAAKNETVAKSSDNELESGEALATLRKRETLVGKPAAAVFGRTLLDGGTSHGRASGGRNWALIIAGIAAVAIVSAAGVTWYLRQNANPIENQVAASVLPANPPAVSTPTATEPNADQMQQQNQVKAIATASGQDAPTAPNQATRMAADTTVVVTPSAELKAQPAVISERVPKPTSVLEAPAEPEKRSLGAVRLAKPKMGRGSRGANNRVAEPELDASSEVLPSADGAMGGLISAGQPSAPAAPVGGDVNVARMISSVPPVYPPMAKTQHVSGDVRIDALIDANGRVSSMKVISGPSLLHQAAMDALKQWKYQPATLDGNPVSMHLTVTIQFRLQ
jgi:TonB family protein